jgi:hypothetical protein
MNTISISRRKFAQLLGAGAACAVAKPAFSSSAAETKGARCNDERRDDEIKSTPVFNPPSIAGT